MAWSESLEVDLQTLVSCHVGVGNQTWLLENNPVLLTSEYLSSSFCTL